MGTAIKHPVPDRGRPSFCYFWHPGTLTSGLSVRVPSCHKLQMTAWHIMLHYSCTHMATVGAKGLTQHWSPCLTDSANICTATRD